MNGRQVEWNGKELELTWARKEPPEIPHVRRRLRAEGARRRGRVATA